MSNSLIIHFDRKIKLQIVGGDLDRDFSIPGGHFSERESDVNDPIFYDWILSGTDIVGIVLHCAHTDPRLASRVPFNVLEYMSFNPFPQIWFRNERSGAPAGLEAFGDLKFFGDSENNLVVVVGLNDWVREEQRSSLIADILDHGGTNKGEGREVKKLSRS